MSIAYNTPNFRKLFKMMRARFEDCNKFTDIEGRVRKICLDVAASELGVSVWSCEGHDEEFNPYASYVMFIARNREAAATLTDVFLKASGYLIAVLGSDYGLTIEHDLSVNDNDRGESCWYPSIVIRHNGGLTEYQCDRWWELLTRSIESQLIHRITLQKAIKECA